MDNKYFAELRELVIEKAAERLKATKADIPGLWNAPGYPELTTAQLCAVAFPGYTGTPIA
jgi:hypothetical protein